MQYRYQIKKRIQGFSLIELMVSLSVFAIVMVVSTGTLITLVDANAKAQALSSAMTNLSFALDSMTREMRMGYHYNCKNTNGDSGEALGSINDTTDCTSGGNFISFTRERDDVRMGYRLVGNVLEQKIASGSWMPLVASDVIIEHFVLIVKNTHTYNDNGDQNQPTINLTLDGYVNNGLETDTDFNIQTHIIQRRLDIL